MSLALVVNLCILLLYRDNIPTVVIAEWDLAAELFSRGPPHRPSAHPVCEEICKVTNIYIPIQMQPCPITIKYLDVKLFGTVPNLSFYCLGQR